MFPFDKALQRTNENLLAVERILYPMLVRYSKPEHVFYKQSLSRLLTDVTHLKQDMKRLYRYNYE